MRPPAVGTSADLAEFEHNLDRGVSVVDTQSGGRLHLQRRALVEWQRLPGASGDYGPGDHNRLLEAAVAAADHAVDFGDVDVVWVVWKTAQPRDDFRSEAWNDASATADGRTLTRAVLLRAVDLDQGWVVAHETGHTLGLPDLYDLNPPSGESYVRFAGPWDLMSQLEGPGRAPLAWHRWMLGWADDEQARCVPGGAVETVELSPVQSDGPTLLAAVRLDRNRVLVAESRRAEGLDAAIPREGVLVYTVDVGRESGHGPVEVVFADGADPGVRDTLTLAEAPLRAGDVYTDAPTGVSLRVTGTGGAVDTVQVDATALAGADGSHRSIAYYRTTHVDGVLVSPLPLGGVGTDAVAFGVFDLTADSGLLRNGSPFYLDTDADAREELRRLQSAGTALVATFGGPSAEVWDLLATDFDRYFRNIADYVTMLGLDGVELDIRTPVAPAIVVRLIDALRHDLGPSAPIALTAPAAALAGSPDPLSGIDYDALYRARGGAISWLALRFYCDQPAPSAAAYLDVVRFQREAGGGVPPEKLVLAAATRPDLCASGGSWVEPADLAGQVRALVAAEPRFGGVAGWEYAGALPGGAAEPWRWYALMVEAMRSPSPQPPVPHPAAVAPASELAASGPSVGPIGSALLAFGCTLVGLALVARRRTRS